MLRDERFDDRCDERHELVARLASRDLHDERVLDALRRVPRHRFVPAERAHEAYRDRALALTLGQTISQPYVVALMTQALELCPGARVLEIGTGCGYQTAVLAELGVRVYSIELLPELASSARATLAELGCANVELRVGDGALGWPEEAPFDAILVAAAPDRVPEALIAQLAPGGRMCIPVGPRTSDQELVVLEKQHDGSIESRSLGCVRFVPLCAP